MARELSKRLFKRFLFDAFNAFYNISSNLRISCKMVWRSRKDTFSSIQYCDKVAHNHRCDRFAREFCYCCSDSHTWYIIFFLCLKHLIHTVEVAGQLNSKPKLSGDVEVNEYASKSDEMSVSGDDFSFPDFWRIRKG